MRRTALVLFALAAHWQAAFAQIVVPASLAPYEKIEAICQKGDVEGREVVYEWRTDPGCKWSEAVDKGKRLLVGAPPGDHWLTVKVTIFNTMDVLVRDPANPDKFIDKQIRFAESLELFDGQFTVTGAGPTPPGPQPPGPEPPGPQPPDPNPPQPGTLAALVPNAKDREQIAAFYADFATLVRRTSAYKTTANFRWAHAEASKLFKEAGQLPNHPAINKPISDRLAAAIGLEDAPLDTAKREALAKALDGIAAELRGG